ncbi:DNA-directed RNA polymerase I subunit RPA43 [Armadillidium nasatum]|uniref:DNA-directed RNA polymerase I subunit RPA43 n=1 Tax=Armadillidium nasatum TaxID=96803 RepID=A0A5N5TEY7_9CRUS|nr:DNA-directed RNA polymerase I subunit RPA43 [Armadillidium nasatum]
MNAVANIKLKDVKELYTQNLSCIKKITSSYTILLHPLYLNDIKNGVKIELNSMLKNYCKQLKGIVLGFEGVKINFPSGWIFDTNPFLHINIVADFYVFSPEIGSILKEEKAEDEDSGISGVEKPNDEDNESENENKKKKKKKKKNSAVENLVEESIESPKKSKKRKRNNLENSNDDLEEGIEKVSKKIKLENSSENLSDENMGEDTKKKKKEKKKIKEES